MIRLILRPVITTNTDDHIGLAVIRSLGRNHLDFQVVSKTRNTLGWYSRYCRNQTVHPFDLEYFSKLSEQDVVFPMIEDVMLGLLENRNRLKCQLAFPDYPVLRMARDKALLVNHAEEQDIPCPRTVLISETGDIRKIASGIFYPAVLKPARGSGGKGIRFLDSPDMLRHVTDTALAQNGPFLIQEKIPFTTKYTVGALMNREHELRRICVIRELRNYPSETGQACFVETVRFPRLESLTEKLLRSLNFSGIADVDFIIDSRDNSPKLMEINPRFWGSMQVAVNAGVDFPFLLYRMYEEGDIEKNLDYKTGVRCRYMIFNDLFRLIKLLRSGIPFAEKRRSVAEFLRFHEDQSYYIFSSDDILPLVGLANIRLLKKWDILRNGSPRQKRQDPGAP